MSIRGFTRFMTNCPQDDFRWGLIPVAVLLVPFLLVAVVLFCTAFVGYLLAGYVAVFMDLIADTAKLSLGVRLVEKVSAYGNGTITKKWNSFCSMAEWAFAKLFICK